MHFHLFSEVDFSRASEPDDNQMAFVIMHLLHTMKIALDSNTIMLFDEWMTAWHGESFFSFTHIYKHTHIRQLLIVDDYHGANKSNIACGRSPCACQFTFVSSSLSVNFANFLPPHGSLSCPSDFRTGYAQLNPRLYLRLFVCMPGRYLLPSFTGQMFFLQQSAFTNFDDLFRGDRFHMSHRNPNFFVIICIFNLLHSANCLWGKFIQIVSLSHWFVSLRWTFSSQKSGSCDQNVHERKRNNQKLTSAEWAMDHVEHFHPPRQPASWTDDAKSRPRKQRCENFVTSSMLTANKPKKLTRQINWLPSHKTTDPPLNYFDTCEHSFFSRSSQPTSPFSRISQSFIPSSSTHPSPHHHSAHQTPSTFSRHNDAIFIDAGDYFIILLESSREPRARLWAVTFVEVMFLRRRMW